MADNQDWDLLYFSIYTRFYASISTFQENFIIREKYKSFNENIGTFPLNTYFLSVRYSKF